MKTYMNFLGNIIWFILGGFLPAFGYTGPIGRKFSDIETYLGERPDSALAVLESMDASSIVRPRDVAKYSQLHKLALDRSGKSMANPALGATIMVNFADSGGSIEQMKPLFFLCQDTSRSGDFKEAMAAGVDTEKWRTESSTANLARAYSWSAMYDVADSLYAVLVEQSPSNYSYYVSRAQNAIMSPSPDIRQVLEWYEAAIPEGVMEVDNYYEYAYALALDGNVARANSILQQLEQYPQDIRAVYYSYKISELEHNDADAFRYLKSYSDRSDSTFRVQLGWSVYRAMNLQAGLERKMAEIKRKQTAILTWSGVIVALLSLLVFLLLLQKHKRRYEAENDKLVRLCDESNRMLESIRLQDELDRHRTEAERRTMEDRLSRMRSSFARLYQNHFVTIGKMFDYTRGDIDTELAKAKSDYSSRLEAIISSVRKDTRNQKEFERILNEDLDGVMAKLRKDYTKFADFDFQLLSYMVAGFDATACSILLDRTPQYIRMKKSRIIQRIKDAPTSNISLYLSLLAPKQAVDMGKNVSDE